MLNVSVEILRPGSYDNMVLNPVTQYIGVCGNNPPVTFQIDMKHQDLLENIRALRYEVNDNDRTYQYQISQFKEKLTNILKKIHGLEPEIESMKGKIFSDNDKNNDWMNIRLVINAKELALLPLEMANSFNSKTDTPLVVNSNYKTIITREIRQGDKPSFKWPLKPKILFIASNPPGASSIPVKGHLMALRSALEAWVLPEEKEGKLTKKWNDLLHIVTDASINDIKNKCEMEEYTHVHILAHGAPLPERQGFGLRFWNRNKNGTKICTGEQLITTLKGMNRKGRCHTPAVVTLATCDSGNVGSSIQAGASIAHALHEGGVLYVLASQFPLTKQGSVAMTWNFYYEILWGRNPLEATFKVRQTLFKEYTSCHDWGSIVAYSNLPENFEKENQWVSLKKEMDRLRVLQKWLEELFNIIKEEGIKSGDTDEIQNLMGLIKKYSKELNRSLEDLLKMHENYQNLKGTDAKFKSELEGIIGSAFKRRAELSFQFIKLYDNNDSNKTAPDSGRGPDRKDRWRDIAKNLTDSGTWYEKSFRTLYNNHWTMSQYLSVSIFLILTRIKQYKKSSTIIGSFAVTWEFCRSVAEGEYNKKCQTMEQIWAAFTLAELYLIKPLIEILEGEGLTSIESEKDHKAIGLIRSGARNLPENSNAIQSTLLQFRRYKDWLQLLKRRMGARALSNLKKTMNTISQIAEECCRELNRKMST